MNFGNLLTLRNIILSSRLYIVFEFYVWFQSLINLSLLGVDVMTKENHEPVGQFGVNETLEVISFGMFVGKGVFDSLAGDNKIDVSDYTNFLPALMQVPDALTGISEIPKEMGELAPEEMILIRDHVLAALPEIGEKWVTVAKSAFTIGFEVLNILNAIKKP